MQNKSFKAIGNVGGGMKRFSLFSLALCSALYSADPIDFTYNGKNGDSYLNSENFTLTSNLTNGNKLTFNYNPNDQGVKNPSNVYVTDISGSSDTYNNTLIFDNGKVTQFLYVGSSNKGKSYSNRLEINGGKLYIAMAGFSNYNDVHDNYVLVTDGIIEETVYGANISGVDTNKAYNNTVEVQGGTIKNVVGAATSAINTNGGDIYNNKVLITGGTINGYVAGGENNNNKSAYSNTVEIKGGEFKKDIYAGKIDTASQVAVNNRVIIDGSDGGNITFANDIILYGGYLNALGPAKDVFTGNTLIIKNKKGISIKDIKNFEFLNFYLPENIAKDDTVLTLSATEVTDLSRSKIGVAMSSGGIKLNLGDEIKLIEKTNGTIKAPSDLTNTLDGQARTQKVVSGVSKIYTFSLSAPNEQNSQDVKKIVARVSEVEDNEKQKNIAETSAMMGAMVNEGAEMASSSGMKNASSATMGNGGESSNFGALGGQNVRLNSGSHVDVKGLSFIAGVSKQANDAFMYGAFVEAGFGNYDSYNDFGAVGSAHGWGDNKYYGGGFLGKFDMIKNYYLEASVRAGRVYSDYKSSDINPSQNAEFESSRIYWGGHIGFGKIFELNSVSNLDIYTKFFVTRLGSDEIEVIGEKIKYYNSNSIRARLGSRYSYYLDDNFEIYGGAAFEREFNSDAKATNLTQNQDLVSPTLKGNTAIGEFGFKFKTPFKPLTLDLNLQGLTGKREGVTGGINAEFKF
ncbi:autotransporter outer membrane beta-barrel domain-containing protein [Campylobacter hyointestinalis]|uniref:autotransporter outer membrane beta-barrel domain-containing protein n=1 Tax=Campylobacter hyointestinalis TaxID=198 RepID=UPI0011AD16B9|nr:autotransporter outer membrane beta-barrel domain-containing protein [Campylobacter hyointestinalis]TWO29103.1 autotransporter outer membrane beta-barrel domain-containing protein [Campylobacter hyointestinalis]